MTLLSIFSRKESSGLVSCLLFICVALWSSALFTSRLLDKGRTCGGKEETRESKSKKELPMGEALINWFVWELALQVFTSILPHERTFRYALVWPGVYFARQIVIRMLLFLGAARILAVSLKKFFFGLLALFSLFSLPINTSLSLAFLLMHCSSMAINFSSMTAKSLRKRAVSNMMLCQCHEFLCITDRN